MKFIEQFIFYKDIYRFMLFQKKPFGESSDFYLKKDNQTIPKLIHRVWVGNNEKPLIVKKCIDSFSLLEEFGYTQKIWNEDNFPIEQYKYAKTAYNKKKWAFVSDVARLHAIYYEGGIYLDTDMEILKSFDNLLNSNGFCSKESKTLFSFGAFGAKKGNPYIKFLLDFYENTNYIDMAYFRTANTRIMSKLIFLNQNKHPLDKYLDVLPGSFFLNNDNQGYVNNYGTGLW